MFYDDKMESRRRLLIDDATGRKILNAAIEIIDNEGFDNLTIRRVAKESGCSNSAIYMRFEDKDALAMAVASLHAKPFLLIMDEQYDKEYDFLTNLNMIMKKGLERAYTFNMETLHMQILYRASLKMEDNPFVTRAEGYLREAASRGEIVVENFTETAFLIQSSFWGLVQMVKGNSAYSYEDALKLLETQNSIIYNGIKADTKREDTLWSLLKDKGVDVDNALERMKGNKEAYKSFLEEFFEDPDFESLGKALDSEDVKSAFEYAHGLKGMAANLGLNVIHSKISALVEILRGGGIEGAGAAYDEVIEACGIITSLL